MSERDLFANFERMRCEMDQPFGGPVELAYEGAVYAVPATD
jgi:hypothetical protein